MINLLQEFKGFKLLPESSFDEIIVEKSGGFIELEFRINGYTFFLTLDHIYDYSRDENGDGFVTHDTMFEIFNIESFAYSDEDIDVEVEITSDEEKEFIDCIENSILCYKIVEHLDNL